MSKAIPLSRRPKVELERMARRRGIRGWQTMTKASLVAALSRAMEASGRARRVTVKSAAKVTRPTESERKRSSSASKPSTPATSSKKATRSKATPPAAESVAKKTGKKAPANGQAVHPVDRSSVTSVQSTASAAGPGPTPAEAEMPVKKPTTATATAPKAPATADKSTEAGGPAPVTKPVTPPGKPTPAVSPSAVATPAVARTSTPPPKDRVILTVNDPYWLHVMWELSAQSVQRAEAALKQDWYGAKLTIRLWDVTSQDTTSTYETPLQDITVEEDGHNWYIHVPQPPRTYRVDIGYKSRRGDFFVLARSNVVTTPKAGSQEALDAGWETDPRKAERIAAMSTGFESLTHPQLKAIFEERFRRPIGSPRETSFGSGAVPPQHLRKFFFELDAKLIVYGRTDPQAHLTLGNDPVELRPDGTFVMEFSLPDTRQIIPAVAVSADGVEERTIVLAIERNTKYLEPIIHDQVSET
ncbi:MAG: DUF4912 domain-containing protein [Gemmataceae bacterium]|nr:DUF4912 domain-containing protein [Gemmataceae bacterium]